MTDKIDDRSRASDSLTSDGIDKLGYPLAPFSTINGMAAGGVTFYRKKSKNKDGEHLFSTKIKKSFIVEIALSQGHQRDVLAGPDQGAYRFGRHAIHIRNSEQAYSARTSGKFDFVVAEVPRSWLARINSNFLRTASTELSSPIGIVDDVLGYLVRCALASHQLAGKVEPYTVEQIGVAFGLHLLEIYGRNESIVNIGSLRLARWQEELAKDLLLRNPIRFTSVSDIAKACKVSTSYFIRAFKSSTGYSPYQWQLRERVGMAKQLLEDSQLSIGSIAEACGFSDVYQFSRSFTKIVGVNASQWKKHFPKIQP
ncbi:MULTISPECIES: AraC family transcriptional regulator [Burkholderia cepacia complex]|uniref:helix-turn-helix domain-containing protein n=1 Tax=Burkholderia cepacia complex TaxID=87882 RepID=UPI001C962258|nr:MULTISPECIES: helix-turn-helix domain-containing protein [Burkholderia cepacia complex]MBY4694818.1 helix-turn-helix domain-containing protein [Burkholderia latens]MDS0852158.1 helix-turn-helix domain-containing protein [Burkholderia cenocepacia]